MWKRSLPSFARLGAGAVAQRSRALALRELEIWRRSTRFDGVRAAYRPLSSLLASPAEARVATVMVENEANMSLLLPLPGRTGLVPLRLSSASTVKDLVQAMEKEDPSVKVRVDSLLGERISSSTPLRKLPRSEILLTLNGNTCIRVGLQADDDALALEAAKGVSKPECYVRVRKEVMSKGAVPLTAHEFVDICTTATAGSQGAGESESLDKMAVEFRDALEKEGLLTPLQYGEIFLLNPGSPDFREDISRALGQYSDVLAERLKAVQADLEVLAEKEANFSKVENELEARALRRARLKGLGVLGGMSAQFCFLFYLVYDVYSWDLMEPAIYTLTTVYTVLGSIYFSYKKRDPTYGNLMQVSLDKSRSKMRQRLEYDAEAHAVLKAEIQRHREVVALLESRRAEGLAGPRHHAA